VIVYNWLTGFDGRTLTRMGAAPTAAQLFGRRVRERRLKLGLSQVELAAACGIHDTYVSSIESGHRNVGLDIIVRLARALDVDPGTLLRGIGRDDARGCAP